MEKIIITVEQEKALLNYIKYANEEDFNPLEDRVIKGKNWGGVFRILKPFNIQEFSFLLNGYYEVEQPFKVGDWYYRIDNDAYVRIKSVETDGLTYTPSSEKGYNLIASKVDFLDFYSKVEESYKIRLLELGRKKPEFKVGDICVTKTSQYYRMSEESHAERFCRFFEGNEVEVFHPIENGIEVKANV